MIDELTDLFLRPIISIWKPVGKSKKDEDIPPQLSFQKFTIQNFKGIDKVEIDLVKNDLVLLLGLNESGKSTILKGIEAFSFLNDPGMEYNPDFFQSIRKKSDVGGNEPTVITATIKIEDRLIIPEIERLGDTVLSHSDNDSIDSFLNEINQKKEVTISRVFPFKKGKPSRYYYQFETDHFFGKNTKLSRELAVEIVNICPFILYFEDFKDRIPEKIYINEKRKDSFDPMWYDIIDGLFHNTNEDYSIEMFKQLYSRSTQLLDDANTVITRVNKKLNKTFTKQWKELSGVQEIEETELKYFPQTPAPFFTLKIMDEDGTTYSVDERSRGAIWYLSFLMKTEFRSKKLRKRSGKPVFLIDEPASNLHSTAQNNMINDFKKLAEDTSIIYTTHSQYLISLENIKNTLIIEKTDGVVSAEKWGAYLNRQDAQVTYYQPLANLLNIIPNSLDVPWQNCVITEGPSDRHVLLSLYRIINDQSPEFVIYPGTSAHDLGPIIGLNLGWNSKFSVLLDADNEGDKAAKTYRKAFNLDAEVFQLPDSCKTIEKCFTEREMTSIRDLIFEDNKGKEVSNKEFASIWAVVSESDLYDSEIKRILSNKTLGLFRKIFSGLGHECVESEISQKKLAARA